MDVFEYPGCLLGSSARLREGLFDQAAWANGHPVVCALATGPRYWFYEGSGVCEVGPGATLSMPFPSVAF